MGRRKNLPQVARLEGNPGKRPVIDDFVEAFGEPFVPEHLCDDAQGCLEVIKRSMPPKVYSALDSFLLAAFAKAWAVHKEAAHKIAAPDFEWIVTSQRGQLQPNPWLRVLDKQALIMASLGDRLGLNPKARAGIKLPAEQPRNKFEGLLGQSGSSRSLNA